MAEEVEGLTIRYQGRPCAPVFEYSRSVGLEPSHGVVFMELEDVRDFSVEELVPDETSGLPKTKERSRGLQSAGKLEFIEVARDDNGVIQFHSAEWQNILVTEKAIEVSRANDDGKNELLKIEITDIRYLWASRGIVSGWFNVPKNVGDDDGSEKTKTGPEAAKAQSDQISALTNKIAQTQTQIDASKTLLANAKTKVERDKIVAGASPAKKAAAEQQKFTGLGGDQRTIDGLESDLGHLEATQKLNGAFLQSFEADAKKAAAAQPKTTSVKPSGSEESVELIPSSTDEGTPWTVRAVLEKVILPNLWGQPKLKRIPEDVAPLAISAKRWDPILPKKALQEVLDEFQLVFVLNYDSSCSIWKKNEGELREEPGGWSITSAPSDDQGEPNPSVDPRVAAERRLLTFSRVPEVVLVLGAPRISCDKERLEPVGMKDGKIVPLEDALLAIGLTLDQAERYALMSHEHRSAIFGAFDEGLREFERWAFKWFSLPGGQSRNAERLPILDARAAFGTKTGEMLPLRVWSNGFTVISTLDATLRGVAGAVQQIPGGKERKRFVDSALSELKDAKTDKLTAVVNCPFAEQASGFTIDHARGIVMFQRVQGPAAMKGTASIRGGTAATAGGSLSTTWLRSEDLHVELEYAYVRKPGYEIGTGLSLAHRYSAVFVRGDGGAAIQRPALPLGTSPLVVHRPDLQRVERLNGGDNKPLLDKIAVVVAQNQFNVALPKKGAVVELCRPVQVELNGSVLSCSWAVNDEIPSTTAHVGSFAPLAPAPKLATRAFGDLARFDRLTKDSTFAPRGLQ